MTIGYTSFEEPVVADGSSIPLYYDKWGGSKDHELFNNPRQNPIAYTACSMHAKTLVGPHRELGFRTFYQTNQYESATGGLADGDAIGVIGDYSTEMQSNRTNAKRQGYGGGEAVHGSQYYVMDFEGGFSFVRIDEVNTIEFSDIQMACWVRYSGIDWTQYTASVRVSALDPGSSDASPNSDNTVELLGPTDTPVASNTEDRWIEYSQQLNFSRVVMQFGGNLYCGDVPCAAWFDYFQLKGYGRTEDTKTECISGECTSGTTRAVGSGLCESCQDGWVDDDADPSSPCVPCSEGRYARSALECVACQDGKTSFTGSQSSDACEIQGCQDEWAENFEPNAVRSGGTCEHSCQSLEMNAGHDLDRCILRSEPESLQSLSLQESWPPCDGTSSGACVEGNTDLWVNRSYIAVGSGIGECRISSESDIGQEGIDFTSYEGDDAQTCQVRLCSRGYMCYGR